MGFKFKFNEDTTLEDAETALKELYNAPIPDLEFSDILRITSFIGCELQKSPSGSMERFRHELWPEYFGIHLIHKGKGKQMVRRVNFKTYLYPILIEIIDIKKKRR